MAKGSPKGKPVLRGGAGLAASLLILTGGFSRGQAALGVQPGTGSRYEASQSAGELDLGRLSRAARTEDAWLFAQGTWVDIGSEERAKSVLVDYNAVAAAAKSLAERDMEASAGPARQLLFYHIHPFNRDPRMVDPPSLQDVHALALLKEECRTIEGAGTIGIVVDGRGKWVYDLPRALETRILHDEHAQASGSGQVTGYAASHGYIRQPDSASVFDLEYPLIAWNAMLGDPSRSREDRIRAFIDAAGKLGLLVTYVAF